MTTPNEMKRESIEVALPTDSPVICEGFFKSTKTKSARPCTHRAKVRRGCVLISPEGSPGERAQSRVLDRSSRRDLCWLHARPGYYSRFSPSGQDAPRAKRREALTYKVKIFAPNGNLMEEIDLKLRLERAADNPANVGVDLIDGAVPDLPQLVVDDAFYKALALGDLLNLERAAADARGESHE